MYHFSQKFFDCGCHQGGGEEIHKILSPGHYHSEVVLEVGDQVPSFMCPAYFNDTKKIDNYLYEPGKITTFFFYPADFTFV